MIIFKYRKEQGTTESTVYRPVADVEFKTKNNEWIELNPYIDSGADVTLFPLSFGRLLGLEINEDEIKELKGVGGTSIAVVFKTVPIKIGEHEFKVKVAWCLKEDVPALLGRKDIFDNFHVQFKQDEKIIEFRETDNSPTSFEAHTAQEE